MSMPVLAALILSGCAQGLVPQTRNVNIPAPQQATERQRGVNERPDGIIYLPLGRDVLVPEVRDTDELPDVSVGPFELRGETLGGALQLILADIDIPIAFQTDLGLTRTVTVTNLKGKLADVVDQVCSLADLYCAFERGALVVKQTQSFTVVMPPIGDTTAQTTMMSSVSAAIGALTGNTPVLDATNRTVIYQATSRTAQDVNRYFQRMRASTSMVVYETYIWEVSLNAASAAGIQWEQLESDNGFNFGVSVNGAIDPDAGTPVSIGLPTSGSVNFTTGDVLKFISSYGAVKTISQPQLTVLSGSSARLRVADTQNFVSEVTRTVTGDQTTVSTETDSVETGFTLEIGSSWDNATVYGAINILLQEVRDIETFDDNPEAIVQLPQTTEREVKTQVRIRPGDSLLIAGLVREIDNMNKDGIGVEKPILPTSRSSGTSNIELVFLLKPRVVAFVDSNERHTRMPVLGDRVQNEVTLDHGAQQATLPVPYVEEALMEKQESRLPETPMVIAPQNQVGSSVVSRLFDEDVTTNVPMAPSPARVTASPLDPSKKVGQGKSVSTKSKAEVKTNRLKKANKSHRTTAVQSPSKSDQAQTTKSASDIAEKILNTPDSTAPTSIPDDLPPLTDGTILPTPPPSEPDASTSTVTP